MRRVILALGFVGLTMSLSACSECFYGLVGEHVNSSHQDGGTVGGIRPMKLDNKATATATEHGLTPSLVGEFRLEKEWDYSYAAHVLGGLRLQNDTRLKWPYFYEVTAGLTHFPGDNLLTVHPNLGFMIPVTNHDYKVMVRLGLPIYFFSGNTEIGTEFTVAFDLPQKRFKK